jgi:hypothetical protein
MSILNNNSKWLVKSVNSFEYNGESFSLNNSYISNPVIFNNNLYFVVMIDYEKTFIIKVDDYQSYTPEDIHVVFDTSDYALNAYSALGALNNEYSKNIIIWKNNLYVIIEGSPDSEGGNDSIILCKSSNGTDWTYDIVCPINDPGVIYCNYTYAYDITGDENNLYICAGSTFIVYDGNNFTVYPTTNFSLPVSAGDYPLSGTEGYDFSAKATSVEVINEKVIITFNFESISWIKTRNAYDISKYIYYNDNERQFLIEFDPETGIFTNYVDWKNMPYGQGLVNITNYNNNLYASESYWHWEYHFGKILKINDRSVTTAMNDFYWPNDHYPREEYGIDAKKGVVDDRLLFSVFKDSYNLQVTERSTEWGDAQRQYLFDSILFENSEVAAESFLYAYPYNYYNYAIAQPWTNSNVNIAFINSNDKIIHSMISIDGYYPSMPCADNDRVYFLTSGSNGVNLFYTNSISGSPWIPIDLDISGTITSSIHFNDYVYLGGIIDNNNIIQKCTDIRNITDIVNLLDSSLHNNNSDRKSCFCEYNDELYFASGTLLYKKVEDNWTLLLNLSNDAPDDWEDFYISSMTVYNDVLYIGGRSVIAYDGISFTFRNKIIDSLNLTEQGITSICAYDDYLYAGVVNLNSYQGYLYEFDGNSWTLRCSPAELRLINLDVNDTKDVVLIGPISDMKVDTLFDNDVLYILESHYKTDITRQNSRLLYCDTAHTYELGSFPRDILSKIVKIDDDIGLIGSSGEYECIWLFDMDNYIFSNIFMGNEYYVNSVFGDFYDYEDQLHYYVFSTSDSLSDNKITIRGNENPPISGGPEPTPEPINRYVNVLPEETVWEPGKFSDMPKFVLFDFFANIIEVNVDDDYWLYKFNIIVNDIIF